MKFTTSDGVDIAYYIDDATPPWKNPDTLILLHPAMGSSRRYFEWIPGLCGKYRVLRMDMRGHGSTALPDPELPLTMERLVQDVAELMDHLGCESAHIAGASAGGYIGQHLALAQPERVRSLLLFSSTSGLKQSNWKEWLPEVEKIGMRAFFVRNIAGRLPLDRMDPHHVEWFLDETGRLDLKFAARFVTLMSSLEWSERLPDIRCPTLIVAPGVVAEGIGSSAIYERMNQLIPNSQLVVYEGFPHHLNDAAPERCVADTLAFLRWNFGSP